MAAETELIRETLAHRLHGGSKPSLVAFCASAGRRAVRPRLAEGEIAAEDRNA